MEVFQRCTGVYKDAADKYRKRGEIAFVSMPIEFQGKTYRQIIYKKSFLGRIKKEIIGLLFVTETGDLVKDGKTRDELMELGYFLNIFFDESFIRKLRRTFPTERDIEREKNDLEYMVKALERIKNHGIEGTDVVENVLSRLPEIKLENTKVLEELVEKVKNYESPEFIFNKTMMDDIKYTYKNVLIKNFQRVKTINKARNFYDPINKEARSRRKKLTSRVGGFDVYNGMNKLEDTIRRLKKVLEIYDKILNMSEEDYAKFLKLRDAENVKSRNSLLRA